MTAEMVPIVARRCDSVSCSRRKSSCCCISTRRASNEVSSVRTDGSAGGSNSLTVPRLSARHTSRLDNQRPDNHLHLSGVPEDGREGGSEPFGEVERGEPQRDGGAQRRHRAAKAGHAATSSPECAFGLSHVIPRSDS